MKYNQLWWRFPTAQGTGEAVPRVPKRIYCAACFTYVAVSAPLKHPGPSGVFNKMWSISRAKTRTKEKEEDVEKMKLGESGKQKSKREEFPAAANEACEDVFLRTPGLKAGHL